MSVIPLSSNLACWDRLPLYQFYGREWRKEGSIQFTARKAVSCTQLILTNIGGTGKNELRIAYWCPSKPASAITDDSINVCIMFYLRGEKKVNGSFLRALFNTFSTLMTLFSILPLQNSISVIKIPSREKPCTLHSVVTALNLNHTYAGDSSSFILEGGEFAW